MSLRELLPPTSPLLFPLEEDSRPPGNAAPRIPPIRVFLHRQVVVEVDDRSSFKTFVIGIGKVWPAPPPITNLADPFDNISVNWEGHVQCEEGVTAPGFNTGNLLVKVRCNERRLVFADILISGLYYSHIDTAKRTIFSSANTGDCASGPIRGRSLVR